MKLAAAVSQFLSFNVYFWDFRIQWIIWQKNLLAETELRLEIWPVYDFATERKYLDVLKSWCAENNKGLGSPQIFSCAKYETADCNKESLKTVQTKDHIWVEESRSATDQKRYEKWLRCPILKEF